MFFELLPTSSLKHFWFPSTTLVVSTSLCSCLLLFYLLPLALQAADVKIQVMLRKALAQQEALAAFQQQLEQLPDLIQTLASAQHSVGKVFNLGSLSSSVVQNDDEYVCLSPAPLFKTLLQSGSSHSMLLPVSSAL